MLCCSMRVIAQMAKKGKLCFRVITSKGKIIEFNMHDIVNLLPGEYVVDMKECWKVRPH